MHESDARLLALARQGDDEALAVILQRYHDPLLRYCRRLAPRGRAEDALQQALLNACVGIRAGAPRGALRPWLYRLTRNAAIDVLRKLHAVPDAELFEDADRTESLEEAFERRERVRSLLRGISGLPSRQRRAVLMRVQGHGHDEIAAHLDVSGDAARQLLRRGRARLREVAVVCGPIGLVRAAVHAASASVPCLGGGALAKVGAGLAAASVLAVAGGGQHGAPPRHAAARSIPAVTTSGAAWSTPTRHATAPAQRAGVARGSAASRLLLRVDVGRSQLPRAGARGRPKSARREHLARAWAPSWRRHSQPTTTHAIRPRAAQPVAAQPSPGSSTAVTAAAEPAPAAPSQELTAGVRDSDQDNDAGDDTMLRTEGDDTTPRTEGDDVERLAGAADEADDGKDPDTDDD